MFGACFEIESEGCYQPALLDSHTVRAHVVGCGRKQNGDIMSKLACLCVGLLAGTLLASFAGASQAGGTSLDPVRLDPEMYKVILENEHVRVIDYRLKPGQKEPMHSHPNGVFVYYFTEANTRGSVLNGETTDTHHKAGD